MTALASYRFVSLPLPLPLTLPLPLPVALPLPLTLPPVLPLVLPLRVFPLSEFEELWLRFRVELDVESDWFTSTSPLAAHPAVSKLRPKNPVAKNRLTLLFI